VKILLGRHDVNPDKSNLWGHTPLHRAAEKGHEGIVKILLERGDVNPDKPDLWGQTPLQRATAYSHAKVVALLQPRTSTTRSAA